MLMGFALAAGHGWGGCGEAEGEAVLSVQEGEHLPCLGVRRLRITAFRDMVDGTATEVFSEFYNQDGSCNLSGGLPLSVGGLPYTSYMWVRVEGFDSSQKRRMCLGETDLFSRERVSTGDLGSVVVHRDAVNLAYPTGTAVIAPLDGLSSIADIDRLDFNVNAGMQDSINGSFLPDPVLGWVGTELVLSSLPPRTQNRIIVVAYAGNQPRGQWRESQPFDIGAEDMFVPVQMVRETP
jgi:hypothetical protein